MTDMAGEPAGPHQEPGDTIEDDAIEADDTIAERAAELATEVTEARQPEERRRLTAAFAAAARSSARVTGRGARAVRRGAAASSGWMAGQVVLMAPRVRVRNQATLRAQFPGMSTEDTADALITGAARASAAVGGAVGAWATLPVLPAFPVEIVTETLALIGIEIKLIAELHELYGMPAAGNAVDRATAYLGSWAHRRGVLAVAPGGLIMVAGSPLARRLRRRLYGRVGRSAFSLGPLFTGAMAGAALNSRETRRLGQDIRADLRREAQARGLPPSRELPADAGWQPPAIDEPGWSEPQAKTRRKPGARLRRRPRPTALPPGNDPPP
jgi:hypothetical protein